MHKTSPLVSIIIATYNRSNILKYTISTVLKQNYQHFEILVIGDHCTDDTESVINSFDDKRISFYNLEENFGEQSYPNNFGFQKSKGELIAWLNHDDLKHIMSSSAFYRWRKQLLAYGIDIATASPKEKNNVIPLMRVLEAEPVGIPSWAYERNLVA